MTPLAITIGLTLVKLGAVGGLASSAIAGIKWFAKYDPKFGGSSRRDNGGEENDGIERLRKEVRSRG